MKGKIKKKCLNCKKIFYTVHSQDKKKFCCKDCYEEYRITSEYSKYLKKAITRGNKLYR